MTVLGLFINPLSRNLSCLTVKHGQLVKKAVCFSSSTQPCHGWLVRNTSKKNIQIILEKFNMLSIHCSNIFRQQVEYLCPPDS